MYMHAQHAMRYFSLLLDIRVTFQKWPQKVNFSFLPENTYKKKNTHSTDMFLSSIHYT